MKNKNLLITLFVGILSLVLGMSLFQSSRPDLDSTTLLYNSPRALNKFELQNHRGELFSNTDLQGKWSFLFLGYLSCPDICPMTMMKLSSILPDLQTHSDRTQVLFLSVDPKRDSAEKVAQYVDYFHPEIVGLRAEHKDLYPLVRDLGLMYSIPSNEVEDNYYVDHSGSIVLINPKGQIHAMFKPLVEAGQVPTIDPQIVLKDFSLITE